MWKMAERDPMILNALSAGIPIKLRLSSSQKYKIQKTKNMFWVKVTKNDGAGHKCSQASKLEVIILAVPSNIPMLYY